MYLDRKNEDCLLALSVSAEGPTIRYFNIIFTRGGENDVFWGIASCFKQRFGKGSLQVASQVEFSLETDKSPEQWADRVIETRIVLHFPMGC